MKKILLFLQVIAFSCFAFSQGDFALATDHKTTLDFITISSIGPSQQDQKGYFTVSAGTGISYGYMGFCLHYMTSGKIRLGFHGGIGYFPFKEDAEFLYSGGMKVFLIKKFYLDFEYSTFRSWYKGYWSDHEWKTTDSYPRYGPGIMAGFAWFFSDHVGLNIAAGIGYNTNQFKEIIPKSDMGISFRF